MRKFVVLLCFFIIGFLFDIKASDIKTNKEKIEELRLKAVITLRDKEGEEIFGERLKEEVDNNQFYEILFDFCKNFRIRHLKVLKDVNCSAYTPDNLIKVIETSLQTVSLLEYGNDIELFRKETADDRQKLNENIYHLQYVNMCKKIKNNIYGVSTDIKSEFWENCDMTNIDCVNDEDNKIRKAIIKCIEMSDDIDKEKCGDYFKNTSGWFSDDYTIKLTDKGESNLFLRGMLGLTNNYKIRGEYNVAATERCGIVNRPFKGGNIGPVVKIKTAWGEKTYDDDYIKQANEGIDIPVIKVYEEDIKDYGFKTGKEFMDWMVGCFDEVALGWLYYDYEKAAQYTTKKYCWY